MLDEELRGSNMMLAESFDCNCHEIRLVEDDNNPYFMVENFDKPIRKLVLKPNFIAVLSDGNNIKGTNILKPLSNSQESKKCVLLRNIYIDPSMFSTLINKGMLSYSKSMAYFYDLPIECARDNKFNKTDYKKPGAKEKNLGKWEQGIFN